MSGRLPDGRGIAGGMTPDLDYVADRAAMRVQAARDQYDVAVGVAQARSAAHGRGEVNATAVRSAWRTAAVQARHVVEWERVLAERRRVAAGDAPEADLSDRERDAIAFRTIWARMEIGRYDVADLSLDADGQVTATLLASLTGAPLDVVAAHLYRHLPRGGAEVYVGEGADGTLATWTAPPAATDHYYVVRRTR